MTLITHIVTHGEPHEDELSSVVAIRQCGTHIFPGANTAAIVTHDQTIHDDGRTEQEWLEQDGAIFVGVRGGEFDDHPHTEFPNDCAFTLVLKRLELYHIPSWRWLNQQIWHEDRYGSQKIKDHLAWVIKHANRFYPLTTVEQIVTASLGCLQARYEETPETFEAYQIGQGFRWPCIEEAMHRFNDISTVQSVVEVVSGAFTQAQESFDQAVNWLYHNYNQDGVVEVYDIPNPNFAALGRPLRMVYVRCREEEMHEHFVRDLAKAARWKDGMSADLVVQLTPQSDGHDMVYISATKRTRFTSLSWLQAQLRWLEQKYDANLTHVSSFEERAADGAMHRWYHHKHAQAIFSGTPTHRDVERTELYRREIRQVALEFLQGCERRHKRQRAPDATVT